MNNNDILEAVKVNLGIRSTAIDGRLSTLIDVSKRNISDEGITLAETLADRELVIMYTCYLWGKRENGDAMPRMLRLALNNRLMKEKGRRLDD